MTLGVYSLAILFYFVFEGFLLLYFVIVIGIEFQCLFLLNKGILALIEWKVIAPPLPLQTSLAVILGRVEQAPGTDAIIDNRHRLQPVSDNNIGVHCRNIDMVNQGQGLVLGRIGYVF